MISRLIAIATVFVIIGCQECRLASECGTGERCVSNKCVGSSMEFEFDTQTVPESETDSEDAIASDGPEQESDTDSETETSTEEAPSPGDPDLHWVAIPGGTFEMGALNWEATAPIHTVTVDDFEMTISEITAIQYKQCVSAGVCTEPRYAGDGESERTYDTPGYGNKAVNFVTWEQSKTFCEWKAGFLPSESQWEYAARSLGEDPPYPWGDDPPEECVNTNIGFCNNLIPVDACELIDGVTSEGLCEMSGNVWEWTEDAGHVNYIGAPSDDSPWTDDAVGTRVIRGGGMTSEITGGDPTNRFRLSLQNSKSLFDLGFRCARFPE